MNCHIFTGSVHENYMFYHGNFIHVGCSLGVQLEISQISQNKSRYREKNHSIRDQLETRHPVERSALSSHPVRTQLLFKSSTWRVQLGIYLSVERSARNKSLCTVFSLKQIPL